MQNIAKLLALTHPETKAFSSMALDLVVRLVKSGHNDVAYYLVQYTVDRSTEEGGRRVREEGQRGVPPAVCQVQVRQQLELLKCVLSFSKLFSSFLSIINIFN